MDDNRHEWIGKRAYALWEQAGRPLGEDDIHWRQASMERDLLEKTRASADGSDILAKRPVAVARNTKARGNVLVVEDEPQLRFSIVDVLDHAGYLTLEAANADEALVLLRTNAVDTLFTDIDMPGSIDGLGLAAAVRATWPATRVIVTSGIVTLSHRDLETGVTFVTKPTSGLELLKLMA